MSASEPRALLLAHDFPPMPGGIARALGEIARHAPPGRLVVSTARLPGSSAFDSTCGSEVDRLPIAPGRLRALPGLVRWGWRASRLARRHQAEFVWAGNLKPAGHVARWLHARYDLPYGLIVYGLDVQRLEEQIRRSPWKRRAARHILGGAAGTIAISAYTAGRFREVAEAVGLHHAGSRVRVIPPGVDAARFHPGIPTGAVRARHRLDARPWLLTVARLVPHKGIDVTLRVLERLIAAGSDAGYAVAGTGPDEERLRRAAAALGLGDRVRFLGQVPEADLPALYNVARAYVGLSRQEGVEVEGFGLSLLEAAACGLPVVAGLSGGAAEAVDDGITGFLVEPESPDAAVLAILALIRDPARAREMGQAGRARVEREFGWGRVARDLGEAAREFRAGPGQPAGR